MPQRAGRRVTADDEFSGEYLAENVETTSFRVYNRVAATKPLDRLIEILGIKENARLEESSEDIDKEEEDDDDAQGYLYVASAFLPKFFGIRVLIRVENDRSLLAVDAAVEYTWKQAVSYRREQLEQFVRSEAAQRAAVATWTVLGEVAQLQRANLKNEMVIRPESVMKSVMGAFETVKKDEGESVE